MPVKAKAAKTSQGAKSKAIICSKVNGDKAEAGTLVKPNASTKTVKNTKIIKKTAPKVGTSISAKATANKQATQKVLSRKSTRNGSKTQSKQKGTKVTKIHPEVEKLVKMLTEKINQMQPRTTANDDEEDEDNQFSETSETDTDNTDFSDDDLSSECNYSDSSDCSEGDDEFDETDDSNSTDDDTKSCSGCSNCGYSTAEFNEKNDYEVDIAGNSDYCKTVSDFGDSDSSFGSTDLEKSNDEVVVSKLQKKPLKKRFTAAKSSTKSKKKGTQKTTKPKLIKTTKKLKKSAANPKKGNKPSAMVATGKIPENQQTLSVSNKVVVKKEHLKKFEPTKSGCSQNVVKKPANNLKAVVKSEPFTSDTLFPVAKIEPGTHCGKPKVNTTFSKSIKKSTQSPSKSKIWRP